METMTNNKGDAIKKISGDKCGTEKKHRLNKISPKKEPLTP